ncbi:hypothetical protein V1498_03060 [Peribacillus sp. SCS-26]|uniref:hypothetical protein n=1 Tax=Paraperibacillus marinus TaxID=3115295 RepID=UPI003905B354
MLQDKIIYWIGGSACAGKSTLAEMYCRKYNLPLYSCDEHFNRHLQQISEEHQPAMSKISRMDANEAFYSRSRAARLRVYIQSFIEDFSFVAADLAKGEEKAIVVEGNQLLPSLVKPLLEKHHMAVWIVPQEEFQRKQYRKREWVPAVLAASADPEAAYENWMVRDAAFASMVYKEAAGEKLNVMLVDGSRDLAETFLELERLFQPG